MSKIEKLIERFKSKPKDFTWDELVKVLSHFGYEEKLGKGSRRKFISTEGIIISLHEPHPKKILKVYVIKLVLEHINPDNNE